MIDIPADFEELAEALDQPEPSGWWGGSAEGGWETPSETEWGASSADAQAGAARPGSSRGT